MLYHKQKSDHFPLLDYYYQGIVQTVEGFEWEIVYLQMTKINHSFQANDQRLFYPMHIRQDFSEVLVLWLININVHNRIIGIYKCIFIL